MNIIAKLNEIVKIWGGLTKSHEIPIALGLAVMLVSLVSFGAGYLTAKEQLKQPLRIIETPQSHEHTTQ
jgi:hypothetical protein